MITQYFIDEKNNSGYIDKIKYDLYVDEDQKCYTKKQIIKFIKTIKNSYIMNKNRMIDIKSLKNFNNATKRSLIIYQLKNK